MKLEDFAKNWEKSRQYEEDLSRIAARLKECSKEGGHISAEEARQLLDHLKRLLDLESYHQIESFALSEARKEYFKDGKWQDRARAALQALGFQDGSGTRKSRQDARRILYRYKWLRHWENSGEEAYEIIAKDFNFNSDEAAKQFIKRARKDHPDIFDEDPA